MLKIKRSRLKELAVQFEGNDSLESQNNILIKIATARCARVSYTVVGEENKSHNYENDIKLHDRLVSAGHWSPFEHCARAMTNEEYVSYFKGKSNQNWNTDLVTDNTYEISSQFDTKVLGWCNNFRGFIQYRHLLENEK